MIETTIAILQLNKTIIFHRKQINNKIELWTKPGNQLDSDWIILNLSEQLSNRAKLITFSLYAPFSEPGKS